METEVQEQQVRDYLKRAEVKTMRKDLLKLREVDAVKERDKIANLKTVEEEILAPVRRMDEGVKKVFEANLQKEHEAEKDLKKYANEAERQQIFLLESEKVQKEDELKQAETQKEPELLLKKNHLLIEQRKLEEKLALIKNEEQKLENEQKYIEEREGQSNVPAEKKTLEESRSEMEQNRQEAEKKRWSVEKELAENGEQIKNADYDLEILSALKNKLIGRIKEIEGFLREIFSAIIAREEIKRAGQAEEQKIEKEELAEFQAQKKEDVQREQWAGVPAPVRRGFLKEEEQRKQFLKNIEEQIHG